MGRQARILEIVGAWGFLSILSFLYDRILYPLVIWHYGPYAGGLMLTLGSLLICLGILVYYEHSKKDWLGVNIIEYTKERGEEWLAELHSRSLVSKSWAIFQIVFYPFSHLFRLTLWALKKNDVTAFVILSIIQDPFVTTAFLRHGRFNGLHRRDWLVFGGSVILSNGWWILWTFVLVTLCERVWDYLSGTL